MEKFNDPTPATDLLVRPESATSEIEDINPGEWPQHSDAGITGTVVITIDGKPRKLKIAAITEKENLKLLKSSRKLDKTNVRETKMDFQEYRLLSIAFSINKANPMSAPITTVQLQEKLTGQLSKIQAEIFKLSGLESEESTNIADFFA